MSEAWALLCLLALAPLNSRYLIYFSIFFPSGWAPAILPAGFYFSPADQTNLCGHSCLSKVHHSGAVFWLQGLVGVFCLAVVGAIWSPAESWDRLETWREIGEKKKMKIWQLLFLRRNWREFLTWQWTSNLHGSNEGLIEMEYIDIYI